MNLSEITYKLIPKSKYLMVAIIMGASSIFFLFGVMFLVGQHRNSLEEGLRLRSQLVLKAIAMESKIDMLLEDTIALDMKTIEYFKSDADINGMAFYQPDGELIFGDIKSQPPTKFSMINYVQLQTGFVGTIKVIDETNIPIGMISISYQNNTLKKMVSSLTIRLVIMSFMFLFGICIILIWLTRLIHHVTEQEAQTASDLKLAKTNSEMQKSFLANMSHELRTPLNAIIGFLKILSKKVKKQENKTNIKYVLDASETMLVLINDILDFSKIESGVMKLENDNFDLNKAIDSVCNSLTPKVPDQVYFDFDSKIEELNIVYGDYHRVKQILTNVINNAIKYTEKGKISVTRKCTLVNGRIFFECSVSDTGIGIEKKAIKQIFTAFKQVHEKREVNKDMIGTGLGLSIVKTLVGKMNGKVWCESIKGKGSKFNFQIYLGIGNKNEIKTGISKDLGVAKTLKTTHVLVAEDYVFNQYLIENTLKNMNITCDIAENGQEVLDKLETGGYDLILMDIQMPVLGGVKTTEIIRASKWSYKDIPIIAITANAIKGDKDYYLQSGMNGYVSKPVDENQLLEELKRFISFDAVI